MRFEHEQRTQTQEVQTEDVYIPRQCAHVRAHVQSPLPRQCAHVRAHVQSPLPVRRGGRHGGIQRPVSPRPSVTVMLLSSFM